MAVCFAVFSPRLKSYSVYSGPKPPIKSNKFSGRYILRVKRLKRIKGIKTMLRSSGARRDTSVRDTSVIITLKMTSAQVVETSVINNSSF